MFGTRTVITVISTEFSNPDLDLDLAAFSQHTHSGTGGGSCKSSVVGMLPVSQCRRKERGAGKKRSENHVQREKRFCPNIVINFCVCVHRDVGGCRVGACENIGAELVGREVPDGELEGRIGRGKSGFAVTKNLPKVQLFCRGHQHGSDYKRATVTDLWFVYIHFLRQSLPWDALGQLLGDTGLILLLNWKMLDLRSHAFCFVLHNPEHTWCILACTQQ